MHKVRNNIGLARQQRNSPTLPEGLIWRELKAGKSGLKFRRQHPVGPYVIDFYCAAGKIGFEIDGIAHDLGANPKKDAGRDAWLRERGITIVRIAASEVLDDPVSVSEMMARIAAERT
jgi:very-short-patch-repair endonuclease